MLLFDTLIDFFFGIPLLFFLQHFLFAFGEKTIKVGITRNKRRL